MKLLTQTSLYMVTLSLFLFFACGIAFYFVFRTFTNEALDKDLDKERKEVILNPDIFINAAREGVPFFDQIEFKPIKEFPNAEPAFYDSIVPARDQNGSEPVRYIRFYVAGSDDIFEVKIYKSKISSDDLTIRITGLITLLALFFTVGIFLLNQYGFKRTWGDFWTSLQKVQNFRAGAEPPSFEPTEIDEFAALNQELEKMTSRISRDYHNLESFTSHTSHEFQTPLAVIRSKVDLLMQSDNLTNDQMREIQNINKYAGHLSRLNQSLSLLFKIDNQQFGEAENLEIEELIKNQMDFIKEQTELRGIKLTMDIQTSVKAYINPSLADILFLNLIKNAIFHNIPDGFINISLEPGKMIISNSGNLPDINPDMVFNEFVKGNTSHGLGLGLSIAKKICDQYGIGLNYHYNNKIHSFLLVFS